jgi:hypothetical protein
MKDSDFWMTPKELYPPDCFDPCPVNPDFDGLKIAWHGKVFCNPPLFADRGMGFESDRGKKKL